MESNSIPNRCNICFEEKTNAFDVHGRQPESVAPENSGQLHFICLDCAQQLFRSATPHAAFRCPVCRENISTNAITRALAILGPVVGEASDNNMAPQLQRFLNNRNTAAAPRAPRPAFNPLVLQDMLGEVNQMLGLPNRVNQNPAGNGQQIFDILNDALALFDQNENQPPQR